MIFYQIIIITLFIICLLFTSYFLYQKYLEKRRRTTFSFAGRITSSTDIIELLNSVKKNQTRIQMKLNARGPSFYSSLLKIDKKHIIIDSLFPKEGNSLISDSDFIEVEFTARDSDRSLDHLPYIFTTKYLSTQKTEGWTSFKISMPREIERNQKREYMRIEPMVNEPLFLSLNTDNDKNLKKIANISAGGLCFYTQKADDFSNGQSIDSVRFVLPDGTDINTAIGIRNIIRVRPPVVINNVTHFFRCGAEFLNIDNLSRDKVFRYVIDRERKELKRISREFE